VSPLGGVSPAVITRACAGLLNWDIKIVDCGVFQRPALDLITAGDRVAECVSTGAAQPRAHVQALLTRGKEIGEVLACDTDYLVVAECVPGGTTTAFGVLTLLGYATEGLISSSLPEPNQSLKEQLIRDGIEQLAKGNKNHVLGPIEAMAAMGDPMQPCAVGIASAAAKRIPVVLAGGCQMLAVYALIEAILSSDSSTDPALERQRRNTVVATTKWVVDDKTADTKKLSQLLRAPCANANFDFSHSRQAGFRAFEQGHVKEGVGAGAALLLAALSGRYSHSDILKAVDRTYDNLCTASSLPAASEATVPYAV
jgi:uncharacterized protein (TIGR00303 family)